MLHFTSTVLMLQHLLEVGGEGVQREQSGEDKLSAGAAELVCLHLNSHTLQI